MVGFIFRESLIEVVHHQVGIERDALHGSYFHLSYQAVEKKLKICQIWYIVIITQLLILMS